MNMRDPSSLVIAFMLSTSAALAQDNAPPLPSPDGSTSAAEVAPDGTAKDKINDAKDATNVAIESAKRAIIEAIEKAKEKTRGALATAKNASEGVM
jgi:hypothetical protein